MSPVIPVRGRVYRADLGFDLKPWLIVSNNARNTRLDDAVCVRITTTRRELPSWVELSANDPLTGFVVCDDIGPIYRDQIRDDLGALSPQTMVKVATALRHALAI